MMLLAQATLGNGNEDNDKLIKQLICILLLLVVYSVCNFTDASEIQPLTLRDQIAQNFSPRMVKVLECESHLQQFSNGKPIISSTDDVGIAQINIPSWLVLSRKMGLDIINSQQDNLTMAKYIYDHYGISQWSCNKRV